MVGSIFWSTATIGLGIVLVWGGDFWPPETYWDLAWIALTGIGIVVNIVGLTRGGVVRWPWLERTVTVPATRHLLAHGIPSDPHKRREAAFYLEAARMRGLTHE